MKTGIAFAGNLIVGRIRKIARLLAKVRAQGIATSLDVVSEESDRY